MNFPGMPRGGGAVGGGGGGLSAEDRQQKAIIKNVRTLGAREAAADRTNLHQMQAAMESCPAKTVLAGTMGFALGGAFGLFMSSVCPLFLRV